MGRKARRLVAVTPFPTAAGTDTPQPGMGKCPGGKPRAKSGRPPQAGQPRAEDGRVAQRTKSHHSKLRSAYKARICQRVSLAEAARPKGRPRRTAGKRTAGITGWRSSEAERATYNRLSWVRIPASACYAAGSPQRETQGPLPPVQTPVGRTKGRKTG